MVISKVFVEYKISKLSKDDIFSKLEELLIQGMPIWEMFNIDDWLKKSLMDILKDEAEEEFKELKKKYVCFRCSYYSISETPFGLLERCNCKERKRELFRLSRESFELQKKCKWLKEITSGYRK